MYVIFFCFGHSDIANRKFISQGPRWGKINVTDVATGIMHACAPRRILSTFHTADDDEPESPADCFRTCQIPTVCTTNFVASFLSIYMFGCFLARSYICSWWNGHGQLANYTFIFDCIRFLDSHGIVSAAFADVYTNLVTAFHVSIVLPITFPTSCRNCYIDSEESYSGG